MDGAVGGKQETLNRSTFLKKISLIRQKSIYKKERTEENLLFMFPNWKKYQDYMRMQTHLPNICRI